MKLRCDVAVSWVEKKRKGARVFVGESKVDGSSGAGRPARQLFAVRNHLLEDVHWASPDVNIRQLSLSPSGLCEDMRGRESGPWVRHVVH